MSIRTEITALERRVEDLEQALAVARNERTGRAPQILAEQEAIRERIAALTPFDEDIRPPAGRMPPCAGCGRPFWPESLEGGRCVTCNDRLGAEGLSESIQTGDLKRRRAPKG